MIIPDHVPLTKVVTNFDLTCCEMWYDGTSVKSTESSNNIQKKLTTLRYEYAQVLFNSLNSFLINRLKKYIYRGFTISTEAAHKLHLKKTRKRLSSNANGVVLKEAKEEWVVKLILNATLSRMKAMDFVKCLKGFINQESNTIQSP
jgi:hypothetical protein